MVTVGGVKAGGSACGDAALFNSDTMKWQPISAKGAARLSARSGHSAVCVREKVYVFGGQEAPADGSSAPGAMLADLWFLDQACIIACLTSSVHAYT
jgi:hypothetical protein